MSNNTKTKFIFFGTPDVAKETLEILKSNGYLPELIVTSPDRPAGRKMILTPPPVKTWAIENNIPYIQPENIKDMPRASLGPRDALGLFIVVAYGKILPQDIIDYPKMGSINIHYSLLPKYRGASPVESAILNGETETGVTIQKMEFKMDTGPILSIEKTQIDPNETTPMLKKRLIEIGGNLLIKTLPEFLDNKIIPIAQEESAATYCKKIKKEDGLIDLNDDAQNNYNKFRAYAHWPRTYFFKNGKRIIITNAMLEKGEFKILKIIPEGGKEQDYKSNN